MDKSESRACSLCGAEVGFPGHSSCSAVMYDDLHLDVVKVTRVELCVCCFTEQLLPWLAAQGAKPVTSELPTGVV
jgi:hypothetical protein